MKKLAVVAMAALVAGCAATYAAPTVPNQSATVTVINPRSDVLAAARRALVSAGYQITAFDDASGIVSTAPRDSRLTPEDAACGTTMGIDYLKDNRTTTRVAYGVIVANGRMEVRANIEGEYKPGQVDQNITLACVSRGVLDQAMADKIKAYF